MNIQNAPNFPKETARSGQSALVLGYMSGFGNGFETEALPGALPIGRNSPQKCSYGLYAEQLSGSPFTAPRASNERSWLYRIRPTVYHFDAFKKAGIRLWRTAPSAEIDVPIAPMRWNPIPIPIEKLSLIEGMAVSLYALFSDVSTVSRHLLLLSGIMSYLPGVLQGRIV